MKRKQALAVGVMVLFLGIHPFCLSANDLEVQQKKASSAASRFWHHEAGGAQYSVIPVSLFSTSLANNIVKALTVNTSGPFADPNYNKPKVEVYVLVAYRDADFSWPEDASPVKVTGTAGKELPTESPSKLTKWLDDNFRDTKNFVNLVHLSGTQGAGTVTAESRITHKDVTVDMATLKRYSDAALNQMSFLESVKKTISPVEQGDIRSWIFGIEGSAKPAQLDRILIKLKAEETPMQGFNYYPALGKDLLLNRYQMR